MAAYRAMTDLPPLVGRALRLAEGLDFRHSCAPEVGRLLRILASALGEGVVAEIGAGCGVGAAWIVAGLDPALPFVTVERDPARAAAVRALFAGVPNVRVIEGDWRAVLPHGPFAMLFADVAAAKGAGAETALPALHPGGLRVLDDLTPEGRWTPEDRARWGGVDPVRAFRLNDPRLVATEVITTPESAVLLATRRRLPAASPPDGAPR